MNTDLADCRRFILGFIREYLLNPRSSASH
jgi:hypothetical protein